jgi:hypothetical protein
MRTVYKSFFGPVSLEEYIQTKIEQSPDRLEFYTEKKRFLTNTYPNLYTVEEVVEYLEISPNKQLVKTKLDIVCRKRDMSTLEYRPYRDYKKNNIEKTIDIEKSKYVPPRRNNGIIR